MYLSYIIRSFLVVMSSLMFLAAPLFAISNVPLVAEAQLQQNEGQSVLSRVIVLTKKGWCLGAHIHLGVVMTVAHCHRQGDEIIGIIFDDEYTIFNKLQHIALEGLSIDSFTSKEARQFYPIKSDQIVVHPSVDIALLFYDAAFWNQKPSMFGTADIAHKDIALNVSPSVLAYHVRDTIKRQDVVLPTSLNGSMVPQHLLHESTVSVLKKRKIPQEEYLFLSKDWQSKDKSYICSGDSGAPIFWSDPSLKNTVLVGLVSGAIGNYTQRKLSSGEVCSKLVTAVPVFLHFAWIQDAIDQYGS